jgi:hypothetical protein
MKSEYKTVKLFKTVTDRLDELRIPRPDLSEHAHEKTYSMVIMDLINAAQGKQ